MDNDEGYLHTRSPEREYEVISKTATIRNKRYRHGQVVKLSEDAAKVLVARHMLKLVEPAEPEPEAPNYEADND